jgi:hypothetical protein
MAGVDEDLVELGEGPAVDSGPGDQEQIAPGGKKILAKAKNFPEAALGPVAPDRRAHRRDRRRDHQAGPLAGAFDRRPNPAPGGERAAIESLALFADGADFGLAAQMLLVEEAHDGPRVM